MNYIISVMVIATFRLSNNAVVMHRHERVRMSTFTDWPSTGKVAAADLARAGFFYVGTADRVQCAFCQGCLCNWVEGDTPVGEHRRHFPECPFVCGVSVENVPSVNRAEVGI